MGSHKCKKRKGRFLHKWGMGETQNGNGSSRERAEDFDWGWIDPFEAQGKNSRPMVARIKVLVNYNYRTGIWQIDPFCSKDFAKIRKQTDRACSRSYQGFKSQEVRRPGAVLPGRRTSLS